ncbi:LLM class oxidoreductase [Amycolatopsis jiangsuensis]|uniref:Alkanesulfonate monooxygenase SsuD/methylene tetrahydromethanopterin reductase-like flavin-dependent oxidoreductase (Luciferase family) n=1 Tax=Amycolatopsis jiangsuensis TaxID=1181879 RepID=A0A840IR60_9PSEU|nr:LLM class flavin-dependent oxidoreductase [Amycolatopsis jiangsuensis]MBB4683935.1 alkanesulfonate monooxygenase SsuD/methylene tetrahydromethanopterin reductase-like flavin-dependent oxidoreductase (luciferase family) [Amycolatopsis jiangsuensis]
MSTLVQLSLRVGPADGVSLAEAVALTGLAADSGVTAIRLADTGALDPSVVAAYLAGVHPGIGYVAEVPTTGNAPYNLARRILSLDRATGGRAGIALRPGDGDEVSAVSAPDPAAADPVRRWAEHAGILTRLWESFPREALLGDRKAAVVVNDVLIEPIAHEGTFYRVAGPIDGPSSVQGRPLVVADLGKLPPAVVAASADVVVTDEPEGADTALSEALHRAGRARAEVALLGRLTPGAVPDPRAWITRHRLDGVELVPAGSADDVTAVLREWAGTRAAPDTLRGSFGLVPA